MAKDFSSYLSVNAEDIPKSIPSLPAGHFFAEVQSWATEEAFYQPGTPTPVVKVTFRVTGADTDVDWASGGMTEGQEVGKLVTKNYTLNDPDKTGQVMLRRLAEETCGLDVKGQHLQDVLDALKGCGVKVQNVPKGGREEGSFFPNIVKVLAAS